MRLRKGCRRFTYDSSPGGADEGMGLSDSGETFYAGGGGSNSTGITYAADTWMGWEYEIAAHSAGLEYYTPSAPGGVPGMTQLSDAGLEALGISREDAPVTYSWFGEQNLKPLLMQSPLDALNLNLSSLQNALLSAITDKINSIYTGMSNLSSVIATSVKSEMSSVISSLSNVVSSVVTKINEIGNQVSQSVTSSMLSITKAISQIGYDAGQYLSVMFNPLLESIKSRLADVQNAFNSIVSTITSNIQQATQAAAAAVQVTLNQVTSGLQEIRADLVGLPEMIALFKAPDLFGEFLIKSLAAAWDKEV